MIIGPHIRAQWSGVSIADRIYLNHPPPPRGAFGGGTLLRGGHVGVYRIIVTWYGFDMVFAQIREQDYCNY